jgi:hypothetical protein
MSDGETIEEAIAHAREALEDKSQSFANLATEYLSGCCQISGDLLSKCVCDA